MILFDLFCGFLRVGCFAFGGAYGAIPLIRDVVLSYGWLTEAQLTSMIAVSESTPGPIMVNLATYVGSSQAGLPGALLATTAVVLPSFVIILLITELLRTLIKHPCTQAVMRGLKPCVIGIVLATGVEMVFTGAVKPIGSGQFDVRAAIISALLGLAFVWMRWFAKQKISPIWLIVIGAVLGVVIC